MLKEIIFADEITLWWTKDEFSKKANGYRFYLNGVYQGETDKTHYSFCNVDADTKYVIRIEAYTGDELVVKKEYSFQTGKAKNRIDVTWQPYGAIGDGKTLNTAALQRALDDCTENDYVYFPAGTYVSGALNIHSDTEIYLDSGAILKGSEALQDYLPKIKSRFEGTETMCYRSLLNMGELDRDGGYSCKNVAIRGKGTIYGGGKPLALHIIETEKELLKTFLEENREYISTCENANTVPGRARGRLIQIGNSENVVLSGLTLGYGPAWNVHFIYSKDIVTYGCLIRSNTSLVDDNTRMEHVWNGDGWDPDSSENCVIFDTVFETGDDCIAIKSGKNPEGNIVNRPTKNVYIFDCVTNDGHSVAMGSEMSGGIENVYIWDCDFRNCAYGVQIKATRQRGGYVKNVQVSDSRMKTIYVRNHVGYNNDGESAKTPPVFSDYVYENITLSGRGEKGQKEYISIHGYEEKEYRLRNVRLKNITVLDAQNETVLVQENTENVIVEDLKYM